MRSIYSAEISCHKLYRFNSKGGIMFFICIMLILFISSFNLLLSMLIEKSSNISLVYEEGNIFGCLLLMLITVVLYFILLS